MSDPHNSISPPGPVSWALTDAQFRLLLDRVTSSGSQRVQEPNRRAMDEFVIPPFVLRTVASSATLEGVITAPKSIIDRFPKIPRETIVRVLKHEVEAHELLSLHDLKGRDADATVPLGSNIHTARTTGGEVTEDDYYCTTNALEMLLASLHVYFDLLGAHAATSGNVHNVHMILRGALAYCSHIISLSLMYEWHAVHRYHEAFFLRRIGEMRKGHYEGWTTADESLMAFYLGNHPLAARTDQVTIDSDTPNIVNEIAENKAEVQTMTTVASINVASSPDVLDVSPVVPSGMVDGGSPESINCGPHEDDSKLDITASFIDYGDASFAFDVDALSELANVMESTSRVLFPRVKRVLTGLVKEIKCLDSQNVAMWCTILFMVSLGVEYARHVLYRD